VGDGGRESLLYEHFSGYEFFEFSVEGLVDWSRFCFADARASFAARTIRHLIAESA